MKTYRDDAIVLRTHDIGEADRIITMLSRNHGKIRAVAKGVRKTASRFGARVEPFSHVDIQVYRGKTLDTISQVDTLAQYGRTIGRDYAAYTAASTIVEFADILNDDDVTDIELLRCSMERSMRLLARLIRLSWLFILIFCARCLLPGGGLRLMNVLRVRFQAHTQHLISLPEVQCVMIAVR